MAARIIPVCSLRDLLRNKSNAVRKVNAVVNAYDAIHSDPQNLDAVFEGQPIDGAVVVEDAHVSSADPVLHYTVDLYKKDDHGLDQPIGVAHVYPPVGDAPATLQAWRAPRTKAQRAYEVKDAQRVLRESRDKLDAYLLNVTAMRVQMKAEQGTASTSG